MFGYVDDIVIVPLGLLLARRLIPTEVLKAHRHALDAGVSPAFSRAGLAIVLVAWLLTAVLVAVVMLRVL